jgi:hydrocephalus-inducing protein
MYKLIGTAKPASFIKTFDLTCKAKENLVQLIPIKNWIKTAQRFNVDWKFDVEDKSVFINAATIFDLAGDSTKDYKLSVYGLKASQVKFTLWLRNPVSFEFISYRINLNVTPSEPLKEIHLSSLVRETCNKLITIENPLSVPVQVKK